MDRRPRWKCNFTGKLRSFHKDSPGRETAVRKSLTFANKLLAFTVTIIRITGETCSKRLCFARGGLRVEESSVLSFCARGAFRLLAPLNLVQSGVRQ
jgi:hypothetical protein